MVHPSELLRTNSTELRTFSAPRNVVNENQFDCGLTNFPNLTRLCNLEVFAKTRIFLIFLSIVGFLQSVTLTYFRETAKLWGKHYNISPAHIDWLIYTNEFFVGVFALLVAYWGNRIHRMSWIGGLTIFQAISSSVLLVPEIYRHNYKSQQNMTEIYYCVSTFSSTTSNDTEVNYIALTILIVFQICFALAAISFICHGITYLDDNTSASTASSYIGIALACRELGKQAGLYFSWIPNFIKVNAVFASPAWLAIASFTFVFGVLISLFPKSMPSTLVRSLAASLVDLASGNQVVRAKGPVDGFFKTIYRLLKNPVLMVNIFCAVSIQSGLINFNIFEKFFNQSRFQIAYDTDTSYTQFTTNILKPPLVSISMIAAGFVVAKTRPRLSSLVKWNIAAIILVIALFGSTAFLKCEPNTKYEKMLNSPACKDCHCTFKEFQPVCMDSTTYYSPCFAGCEPDKGSNSGKFYNKCGCKAGNYKTADGGPCEAAKCDVFYALSQVNRVLTTALLASTLITNLMINMRCVLRRDKAVALGLEATFICAISFLPIKAIYGAVAENYCIKKDNICRLYSNNFATFLSLCTMGLMVVSLILAVIVLILFKLKPIEENRKEDDDSDGEKRDNEAPIELQEIDSTPNESNRLLRIENRDNVDSTEDRRTSGSSSSVGSMTGSLLEMENVGDDHDSLDSASRLDDTRPSLNRKKLIESDL